MILSDNETKLDLLNNRAIAKTIVSIIMDSKEAVSIGVHGDWGAGKSSILAMVEDEVEYAVKASDEKGFPFKAACIRFNGWQHQGFEDSKVALMSAIVSQLIVLAEEHPVKEGVRSVKEIAKNLWKNINWLSVAKQAGAVGFSLATGTAPLTILTSAFDILKGHVDSKEHVQAAVGSIGEYIQNASVTEDTSSLKEFNEFRENFKELLEAADIDKLIVIIDDLDRCLPEVAIETLESIRLFMFMEETAFVIGADDIMIRYAVKKHFPDMEKESANNHGDNFADKYLEKLIQVPFKIPTLGEVESQLYIMLLMVGSKLNPDTDSYRELVSDSLKKLEKPWDIKPYDVAEINSILGDSEYEDVQNEVIIALQISPILYDYSRGNPRVIKRFINMLLLRYAVAKNRGFGEEIDLQILAKLMLAEISWPLLYQNIALHLTSDGKSQEIALLEAEEKKLEDESEKPDLEWIQAEEYRKWILSKPSLTDIDLRPYYIASKERKDFFAGSDPDEVLREIVSILMTDDIVIAGHKDEIKALTEESANKAFEIVSKNITSADLSKKPNGFSGLQTLAELHPTIRMRLVNFVSALPYEKLDVWIIAGWDKTIPAGTPERRKLEEFFEKLADEGNGLIKQMMKNRKQ